MQTLLLKVKVETEIVISITSETDEIGTDDNWKQVNNIVCDGLAELISNNNIEDDFEVSLRPITSIQDIPDYYDGDEIPYSNDLNNTLNILDVLSLSKKS